MSFLRVEERTKPSHLTEEQAQLRRGLRAKQRQLGGEFDVLVWDAAYEQWHRLLFARFLAENGLLRHPEFGAPVTLAECEELAEDLGEPDGWSVAARFAAEILPGLFRLEDPCVQLRLAPEHRAALEKIIAGLPKEVFTADDSLGWVYQYWQAERKDQVNASEEKIGGADLGPVTQLFTENYMVRFLLENSLGAWWTARHPDSPLVKDFEYLRFDEDGNPAAGSFDGWPEPVAEVTVMDPCCGSGHFLVEAFGMLWQMRVEEEGLDPIAAQDSVLRDNLFGLELDPRCVQIAMFAVALTAWKQGGGWRVLPTPNIACSGIPVKASLEEWTALAKGDERLERALERLHTLFKDADTLGSLIDPRRTTEFRQTDSLQRSFDEVDVEEVIPLLEKAFIQEINDPATAVLGADAAGIGRAALYLSGFYTLITTNYPYLGMNRQSEALFSFLEDNHNSSKADLSTALMSRFMPICCSSFTVLPQNWMFIWSYKNFRKELLTNARFCCIARLGSGAFSSISGEVVQPVLIGISSTLPVDNELCLMLEVSDFDGIDKKKTHLKSVKGDRIHQHTFFKVPDSRIVVGLRLDLPFLEEFAESYWGIGTGDGSRFQRVFWELGDLCYDRKWVPLQQTFNEVAHVSGRTGALKWEGGEGQLFTEAKLLGNRPTRGSDAWGKKGVVINLTSNLAAALYDGSIFQNGVAAIIPHDEEDQLAVWSYCSSSEYVNNVRRIDPRLGVTNATLLKVPFDVDHWRKIAAEEYPGGLLEQWSDDPTQWLFEGRPEVTTEPLQVGVGRLVGYRWPEQPSLDDLDELTDEDGIVCLPAVGGELSTADRLQALLIRAYGDKWSSGLIRQLLEQADSNKKNLTDWLRDDFFKHQCKVFLNRPFVWHIWDGRKDGFAALVNYHRLDRAGLEKLTYTYLGDWIERQWADAAENVAGADSRLAAAKELKGKLEAILAGEKPYDIYVRWKGLHEQPIGWEPDLDDGVRLNIRPFVEAGILRAKFNVHWKKDRGKNPDGSERINDLHYTIAEKQQAREKALS